MLFFTSFERHVPKPEVMNCALISLSINTGYSVSTRKNIYVAYINYCEINPNASGSCLLKPGINVGSKRRYKQHVNRWMNNNNTSDIILGLY